LSRAAALFDPRAAAIVVSAPVVVPALVVPALFLGFALFLGGPDIGLAGGVPGVRLAGGVLGIRRGDLGFADGDLGDGVAVAVGAAAAAYDRLGPVCVSILVGAAPAAAAKAAVAAAAIVVIGACADLRDAVRIAADRRAARSSGDPAS